MGKPHSQENSQEKLSLVQSGFDIGHSIEDFYVIECQIIFEHTLYNDTQWKFRTSQELGNLHRRSVSFRLKLMDFR